MYVFAVSLWLLVHGCLWCRCYLLSRCIWFVTSRSLISLSSEVSHGKYSYAVYIIQALTLDCGNHWKSTGPPKKPLAPPKTCNDPNVFAAGIYDFTREVAHFCTLGLYITKKKYELTLPSEFCRFTVKIMAAYEALSTKKKKKKKKNPLARGKLIVVARTGPTASKRHAGQRAHSQCQGLLSLSLSPLHLSVYPISMSLILSLYVPSLCLSILYVAHPFPVSSLVSHLYLSCSVSQIMYLPLYLFLHLSPFLSLSALSGSCWRSWFSTPSSILYCCLFSVYPRQLMPSVH